jgi:hypothetical protein
MPPLINNYIPIQDEEPVALLLQSADLEKTVKELKTENEQLRKVCENYLRHCRCSHQSVFGIHPKCFVCQEAEKLLKK